MDLAGREQFGADWDRHEFEAGEKRSFLRRPHTERMEQLLARFDGAVKRLRDLLCGEAVSSYAIGPHGPPRDFPSRVWWSKSALLIFETGVFMKVSGEDQHIVLDESELREALGIGARKEMRRLPSGELEKNPDIDQFQDAKKYYAILEVARQVWIDEGKMSYSETTRAVRRRFSASESTINQTIRRAKRSPSDKRGVPDLNTFIRDYDDKYKGLVRAQLRTKDSVARQEPHKT